jgi:hypothetical protein
MRQMANETAGRAVRGSESNAMQLAGAAGAVSIALGVVALIVDQMWLFPDTGSTGAEIAVFVHAHRTALLLAMALNTAAVTLWLMFGAGVGLWLREATGRGSLLPACFGLGLASFITLLLAGFLCFVVLVYRVPSPSEARLLYDVAVGLLAMSGAPTALALGSYAGAVFATAGHLPRWTGSLAVVGALAHVALLASFAVTDGFFSLEGAVIIAIPATLFAWILGMSVAMLRRVSLRGGPSTMQSRGAFWTYIVMRCIV